MKYRLFISTCFSVLILACSSAAFGCGAVLFNEAQGQQKGYVTGKATDSQGRPLQGVRIIIDHGLFYNTNMTATTDAAGRYKVKVPNGAWYAFAQYKKTYNGKTYSFYLKPDSSDSFGSEGAVRNFVWATTGRREEPLAPGFFGGTITVDSYPGTGIIERQNDIEFTLTPVGPLIDGSEGETLRIRSKDNYTLKDVPMGRYRISAVYRGKPLLFRIWNTDTDFVRELEADFEPTTGVCDNCMPLQYKY